MGGGSIGQTVGSIVGGAIGGYVGGYPGFLIGSMIGGMVGRLIDPIDGPKKPDPQGDLTINSYVRNAPLAVQYGQDKAQGGVIAKGPVDTDVDQEGGGKDTPGTFEVSLQANWAVAHCEGPVELANPEQQWANDKLIGSSDDGASFSITTHLGAENQAISANYEGIYAGAPYPFLPLKFTCWSEVYMQVPGNVASTPNIAVELRGFLTEVGELDANPIRCAYDFLTNSRYGMGIDIDSLRGDPDTIGSPWKTASDYCDELVSYVDSQGNTQQEPRFRYSRWIGQREKGFDILTDLFSSCRGLLRYKQGKLEPLVENPNEVPEYYYSERTTSPFTTGGGCTVDRIYSNFSAYPDQFWKGSSGTTIDPITNEITEFFIYNQTSTYIDLCDSMGSALGSGISFTLLKDNIKEGSFNFKMIPEYSIPNVYRVDFINRQVWSAEAGAFKNEYQNDVVEHETPDYYAKLATSSLVANFRKVKTIKFAGVKRKSQCMRMAQFFSDATTYARLTCSFITGVEGYQHAVGDIIGISHVHPGWDKKWFRIVNIEEKEEDEISLGCLEYNPYVYSDAIVQVFATNYNSSPSSWADPQQTERFIAFEDTEINRIWLCFKRPENESYWYGAQIFVQKGAGAEYLYENMFSITTPSVKLASDITDIVTTIPFDNSTLYGSFPTSGGFWIEREYIAYTGIDNVNHAFTGCTRTFSRRWAHTADKYCCLKQVDTPFITFEDSDIGNEWSIKVVTYTAVGRVSDLTTAPNQTLTLVD
jgi:hypothetical protein